MTALGWIVLLLAIAAALVALAAWFFERASGEVALVRTGVGGRKVVSGGGTLALPFFSEISRVNMQTLRMMVRRAGESSLITRDRLRVDVGAEFYASVMPDTDSIARAAQTLGRRTFQPDQLTALLEGMLVDALRAVAAQMTLDELHEDRAGFVARVRDALGPVLTRYGLQIDSVSLTELDQTPFSALDENNAFNAEGMRKLAEVVARSRKERAEIEGESRVSVRRTEVEAARRVLEIELEERRAQIAQTQEVETLLAAQLAEVARRKAEAEREAARARIDMEREIEGANVARVRALREAEIAQALALGIAEEDSRIATAAKSQEGSRARAEAVAAQAAVVEAEEELKRLREIAEAARRKEVALLAAAQEAETAATRERAAATLAAETASARARARREAGEAEKAVRLGEAEVERARIEARNARSEAESALEMEKARLAALPGILEQMVKPAEKITGISVNHVSGLGRGGPETPGTPVDATVNAILDMAVALPTMRRLGERIGVDLDGVLPEGRSPKGG